MVYLDYSATTPVDKMVLESFNKTSIEYIGNPNSLHKEGVKSKKLMQAATKQIADILKVKENEIIFTSSASESNNLAITGVVNKYQERGKHIITTKLEHSSILSCVSHLEKNGYRISYVDINLDGKIDMEHLKSLINDDTVLVSICEVNSEIGIIQNVNEIGEYLKKFPRIIFHVDGTQAVGKKRIDLSNIDLYSFSSHKIYGLKGIGCLVKKENIELEPMIYGGKSQTIYRAGTPPLALITSFAKALKLANDNIKERIQIVKQRSELLKNELKKIKGVVINSNNNCIDHIVNISIVGIKPETLLHALEEDDIYISTKTACSSDGKKSLSVFSLTKNEDLSLSSIRISISHLTTVDEINLFLDKLKNNIYKLLSIRK